MRASADTTAGHGRLELLCVLRQQIFWSLGLAANPTWSSPQDSREKEGEKERERGIEKKARISNIDYSIYIAYTNQMHFVCKKICFRGAVQLFFLGKKEEKKSPKTHKKRFLVFILHFFYLLKAIFFSSKKLVLVRHSRASLIVVRNKKGTKCGLGYPLPLLGTKSQPLLKTRV